jgi:hypothetical protein
MVNLIVPDDYEQLQDAINAIPDGQSGDIHVREGIHVLRTPPWPITSMITLKSNLRIHGDGMDKTILRRSDVIGGSAERDIMGNPPGEPLINTVIEDLLLDGYYGPVTSAFTEVGGGFVLSHNYSIPTPDPRPIHKGIVLRRVGSVNSRSGFSGRHYIGTSWDDPGITVEDCYSDNVWTNLTFVQSDYVKVLGNDFRNAVGDAIFPQSSSDIPSFRPDGGCRHWLIDNNDTLNSGDTAIDITSYTGPHQDIVARNNRLVNGHVRVSGATDVLLEFNSLEPGTGYKSYIGIDNGADQNTRIKVNDNTLECVRLYGIRFVTGRDSEIRRNKITFTAPYNGQTGITAALNGTSFIEGNTVDSPSVDGINFGNWGLGGDILSLTIRDNRITNFGRYGVYDSAKSQARVEVLENQMYGPSADWAVFTGYSTNSWMVQNNGFTVGALDGDQAVNAPGSTVSGNTPYIPADDPVVDIKIKNEDSEDQTIVVRTIIITETEHIVPSGDTVVVTLNPATDILVFKDSS